MKKSFFRLGTAGAAALLVLLFASCGAGDLPAMVLEHPGGTVRFFPVSAEDAPADFPPGRSKKNGSFYSVVLPEDSLTGDCCLSVEIPPNGAGEAFFYTPRRGWFSSFPLRGDKVHLFAPGKGDSPVTVALFNDAGKDSALPVLRLSREAFGADAEKTETIRGLTLEESVLAGGETLWALSFDKTGDGFFSGDKKTWRLTLHYHYARGPEDHPGVLRLTDAQGREKNYDFFPKEGGRALVFQSEAWNGFPKNLKIQAAAGFRLDSVSLDLRGKEQDRPFSPITADSGTMLHYPREQWRNPDYEFFRWVHHPEIVCLVFGNLKTQSRFLRRLAFYVEKEGFVGRLARNEEIESLHDWNAHDYRPEDLARFFQQAREENFSLDREEYLLLDLLLENGLLLESGGKLQPGSGALTSMSTETFYEQLSIFFIHEFIHGLYFTSPEVREMARNFWHALSPEELFFWENFLNYRGYNVREDQDLFINETLAYLLQQPPADAGDYFIGFISPRLLASRPRLADELIPWLQDNPNLFEARGEEAQGMFADVTGLRAENFHDLLPADRSKRKIFQGQKAKWFADREERAW